jgi:hypothetical protein
MGPGQDAEVSLYADGVDGSPPLEEFASPLADRKSPPDLLNVQYRLVSYSFGRLTCSDCQVESPPRGTHGNTQADYTGTVRREEFPTQPGARR